MITLNIQILCRRYPILSPFASWHGAMINPQWLELPISWRNFYRPKDVRAIEVRLYCGYFSYFCTKHRLWVLISIHSILMGIGRDWAGEQLFLQNDRCSQRWPRSVCAPTPLQSDLSLLPERRRVRSLANNRVHVVKTMIRLRRCAGWSESLLCAHTSL